MPKGFNYGNESYKTTDPKTGASVIRLTGHPTIHNKLYMHVSQCTPDSKTVVYYSMRELSRDSFFDLWRVDLDGKNNTQLTERPDIQAACLDSTGKWVYFIGGGNRLWRVHMETFEEQELAGCDDMTAGGLSSVTEDGRYYYCDATLKNGPRGVVVFDTVTGRGRVLYQNPEQNVTHVQHDPSGSGLVGIQLKLAIGVIDAQTGAMVDDGLRISNGHWGWLGKTGLLFTNCRDSHNYLATYDHKTQKLTRVAYGNRIFWHAGCSEDGKWLVSDTNWPPEGVYLFNVATGKHAMICDMQARPANPQWSHPHPSLTLDNRYVMFNASRNGFMHIFAAEIRDEIRWMLETPIHPDKIY